MEREEVEVRARSGRLTLGKARKLLEVRRRKSAVRPAEGQMAGGQQQPQSNQGKPSAARKSKAGGVDPTRLPKGLQVQRDAAGRVRCVRFSAVESLERQVQPSTGRRVARPNHVKGCTCPDCRKAQRLMRKAPIELKYKASIRLVEATMEANGFVKTTKDDFNVLWVSGSVKPHLYHTLSKHQKVNQFPRTYEITRKDQLCRNMTRMQQLHGAKHFDFFPKSYVLPEDREAFEADVRRRLSDAARTTLYEQRARPEEQQLWIVKPAASACGRGIYVTGNVGDIPLSGAEDGNVIVSEYIKDPLLLDERKFDLRVYVAVTSFSPLRVYVYEEGLVRLTTEAYTSDPESLGNRLVHLTNYSVQKKSEGFVGAGPAGDGATGCDGADDDDDEGAASREQSSKWSLKTFRARLAKMGVDAGAVFAEIESLVVKTLISIEPQVVRAMEMHLRHRKSSFQLFGFDVLLDSALKPWLIEVNLGPSLGCDSALDLGIKSRMLAELLTLAGVQPSDVAEDKTREELAGKLRLGPGRGADSAAQVGRLVRELREEQGRAGGWRCAYPSETGFVFNRFFDKPGLSQAVVQRLSLARSASDKRRVEAAVLGR